MKKSSLDKSYPRRVNRWQKEKLKQKVQRPVDAKLRAENPQRGALVTILSKFKKT
jgi:hypothetical protein